MVSFIPTIVICLSLLVSPAAKDRTALSCPVDDGIINGVESVTVPLESEGDIYYTLDGSLPTNQSHPYEEPLILDETTVVRAISYDGESFGDVLTLSFIINENHTLPVISLVSDAPDDYSRITHGTEKGVETLGYISLFGEDAEISEPCGISLSGRSSARYSLKKSIRVDFGKEYGAEKKLHADLFGDGETKYSSLILRAGTDSEDRSCINEIWQDLAMEMSDSITTQHGKFCILYVNGNYRGIYTIKENVSRSFYAVETGVSKNSVESANLGDSVDTQYFDVYKFCYRNDLSDPENYAQVCAWIDVDSLIDFVIMEAVSANEDLYFNVRAFRSSEQDNLWRYCYYDLDAALLDASVPWNNILSRQIASPNETFTTVVSKLWENEDFRQRLLKRYSEVFDTSLSNGKILERIDCYEQLLEPEIDRDRKLYGLTSYDFWKDQMNHMRKLVTEYDWQNHCVKQFCRAFHVSDEERLLYFGF